MPANRVHILVSLALAVLLPIGGYCQISPSEAEQLRKGTESRIEALTVFGGDYVLGGGQYRSTGNGPGDLTLDVSKFGGYGEFGDTHQFGDSGIAWRPMVQGNMGSVDWKNEFKVPLLDGDISHTKSYAIEFGGGARFWFSHEFSVAPTIMGLYGHTYNEYTANSVFMLANLGMAREVGLVDWSADTWTVRPAVNFQYEYTWKRTVVTLSSDAVYFHTGTLKSSSDNINVAGDSEMLSSKLDIDVPLGRMLFGHEIRTGGYLEHTDLFGNIKDGLNTNYMNEVHGRLVLDYLNQLWLTQWIGLGGSYYWGGNFTGWSVGIDFYLVF
ncbi:MAG TPA: hypothetical protein VGI65_03815 [Steroidobacteraceae bacterium]|jgi:hypothetical protein